MRFNGLLCPAGPGGPGRTGRPRLMYEVCTTPKPAGGPAQQRQHRDMDLFTFLDSTTALLPYWHQAVSIGQETAGLLPEETFARLREAGLAAERTMFRAPAG